jgi:predicted transposase YbfD/YdcC
MTPRETAWQTTSTVGKEHDREERRTLESTTTLNFYLAERLGWSSVRQVFRVTRDVAQVDRVTGERKKSREVVYGITNLSRKQADAEKLLELNRGHWTIENGVFYVRDEAFGEDRCQVRKRSGPQILAGFRNAALNLLRLAGSQNISANLRSCTRNIQYVKRLLGIVN